MDNLLSHRNRAVIALILEWGYEFCFCAPYYLVDSAIEYVFNTIEHDLMIKLLDIINGEDLRNEVLNTVSLTCGQQYHAPARDSHEILICINLLFPSSHHFLHLTCINVQNFLNYAHTPKRHITKPRLYRFSYLISH